MLLSSTISGSEMFVVSPLLFVTVASIVNTPVDEPVKSFEVMIISPDMLPSIQSTADMYWNKSIDS